MFTIHLDKLEFFSHHGIYAEERILGTFFELSASIAFDHDEDVQHLADTINYVDVYNVIRQHMNTAVPLLENLLQKMAADIYALDGRILKITLSIKKLHPPLDNFSGSLGVSYCKEYRK